MERYASGGPVTRLDDKKNNSKFYLIEAKILHSFFFPASAISMNWLVGN